MEEFLSIREIATYLGMIAFGLISFRLAQTWTRTPVVLHAVGLLLASSLIVSAMGTYGLHQMDAAPSTFTVLTIYVPIIWLVIVHRVATIIVALMWGHWLDRRTSPFRRAPIPSQ